MSKESTRFPPYYTDPSVLPYSLIYYLSLCLSLNATDIPLRYNSQKTAEKISSNFRTSASGRRRVAGVLVSPLPRATPPVFFAPIRPETAYQPLVRPTSVSHQPLSDFVQAMRCDACRPSPSTVTRTLTRPASAVVAVAFAA